MCSSPIHVTSSQLISSEIFPVPVIKALLYPGAIVNGLATNMTFPKWENVLDIYNLTNVKEASAVTDLQRLEVRFIHPEISSNKVHSHILIVCFALYSNWLLRFMCPDSSQ